MRKSPKKIIESQKNPQLESRYIKFPGEEMEEISIKRTIHSAGEDIQKSSALITKRFMKDLEKKNPRGQDFTRRGYTDIHTHPVGDTNIHTHPTKEKYCAAALPSKKDISLFLKEGSAKTMVIAQTDNKTGDVQGYFILRKKENHKSPRRYQLDPIQEKKRKKDAEDYEQSAFYIKDNPRNKELPRKALRKLAKEYSLQYRWVPAKRYELSDEKKEGYWKFMKKRRLENIVTIILLFSGLVFLSPNITGNAIANFNQTTTNSLGATLLLIGLVGRLFILKKRKK